MTEERPSADSSSNSDSSNSESQSADFRDSSSTAATPPEQEIAKLKSDYLYLYADFENYKKQSIKERSDLRKFGAERLASDLLGVLDILETALASAQLGADHFEAFKKGIEMTANEFKSALKKNGIEEAPALGVAFDPMVHEALSSEDTVDFPEGHVSRVFKKPYRLHDRVIRPGQVVVARKPAAN